jgi:PQQ-like domain
MRSVRRLAAVAAVILAGGLAPAVSVSATTATAVQWHGTFATKNYTDYGTATTVSPNGKTVFAIGEAFDPSPSDTGFAEFIAYNAATGAVVWKDAFNPHPGVYNNELFSIAVSPDNSTVFVTGMSGDANQSAGYAQVILAYNAATGKKLWQVTGPLGSGGDPSPIVVSPNGQTLFTTGGGGTVAYDAATGKALWTEPNGGQAIALSANASTLYVTSERTGSPTGDTFGGTEAFSATTGNKIWQANEGGTNVNFTAAKLSPDGSTLYVSGSTDQLHAFVVAYSTSTGAKIWSAQTGNAGNKVGLGVTSGGSVIVSEGINGGPPAEGVDWVTMGLNPATGKTLWRNDDDFKKDGPNAYAYAMSPDGSIAYITGWTSHPPKEYGDEYLTIGFSTATGKPVWTAEYSGERRNYGYAMAVSPNGSQVVVTGTSNTGVLIAGKVIDIMDTVSYRTG